MAQPGGNVIRVYLRGDEFLHWTEDERGYTILLDAAKKAWVYATLDAGGQLTASDAVVGEQDPAALDLQKHLLAPAAVAGARQAAASRIPQVEGVEGPLGAPKIGTMKNLVLLVGFADKAFTRTVTEYQNLFNTVGYTTDGAQGSVKDYYKEVSYNQLNVDSVVVEPVTLANSYAYYGGNDAYGDDAHPREMVREALAALEARGFDFSTLDNDNDGWVDGLTVIHAGGGEEYSGNDANYIWSHQWAMASAVTYDGKSLQTYHTEPERRGWDSYSSTWGITRIGVICHENAHFIGLPDLYDYGYDSMGCGNFCLMAGGSWNGTYGTQPAHMNAWCKKYLTWLTPSVVTASGTYSLPRVEDNQTVYRLSGGFPSTQYFLIENRQGYGFDASMPGSTRGVLVWHVDETVANNDSQTHYKVDLEEASGTQHLELNTNSGDDADYFRSGTMTTFNYGTTPNSRSYSALGLGMDIANVSASSSTMSVTILQQTVQFKAAPYSVAEGAGTVRVTVSRTGSSGVLSVSYSTAGGTALSGADFKSKSGTLSWADGDAADKYFDVAISDDVICEGAETFTVALSSPSGVGLGTPSSTVVTITDNDPVGTDFVWSDSPASDSWNTTDVNWTGAGVIWANAPSNNATFGVSDTKTVSADPVTLSNLTFTADGYTIGGGRLTMYGVPSVASGLNAVLSATVTNIGVWTKGGDGTLTVDPGAGNTNVFYALKAATGTVHIVSGINFVIQSGSDPEKNPFFWVTGGKLVVGGGIVKTTGNKYARVSEYGTLLITNGIVDLTSASQLLNGHNSPGVVTVSDTGVLNLQELRITQNSLAANLTAVNVNTGGVIRLSRFDLDTTNVKNGTVNFNGGMIVAKDNVKQQDMLGTTNMNWRNIVVNVLPGGAIINNNGCNITLRQNLTGSPGDGGLTKLNSGNLYLLGTNSYTGATVLKGGALNIIRDHNLGAAPASPATNVLFVTSSTLQSSDNHALGANRTIWVTNAVTATFDTQAYTQTVYGTVMCAETNSTVVKSGSGSLVLDPGPTAVNVFGTLQTTAGTLVIASGTNLVTTYNNTQNAPGLRVSGGTMLVAGGVVMTTTGSFVNVEGGHLLVTNGLVDTTSCWEILNGIGSTCGFTTVSGSGTILANGVRISQNSGYPSNNVVSVNTGGVMRINNFYIDVNFPNQQGMLFLNGGTVEARVDNVDFLGKTENLVGNNYDRWLTNIFVHVREGGAIFNTAGKNISIKQPLYTGAPVDGGLTKRGAGTLTLLNTNTYNGVTSVEGGTLTFGRDNLLPATGTAWVSSNAVLNANGKTQTLAGIGGGGTVNYPSALTVSGTVAPGDAGSFGTLTLAAAPAALGGTLSVNVSTNGACDRLHVNGSLDVSALSLKLENPAQLNLSLRYVVATCEGMLAGTFQTDNLPKRWRVRYDRDGRQVVLYFDSSTLLTIY